MMNNTPSGAIKRRESTEPESHQTAKIFFFFFFRRASQICVTLSRWLSHKTAAFFTEQCTSPSLFSRFEVTRGDFEPLTEKLRHFFLHLYACAQIT